MAREHLRTVDSHVHVGSIDRLDEVWKYAGEGGLARIGALSLPLTDYVHFNIEVLAAKACAERAQVSGRNVPNVDAFLSFDYRDGAAPPAAQVEEWAELGADGVKMWEGKPDAQVRLGRALTDPRFVEAYRYAGRHGMPVLIHVADPPEFWERTGGPWSYIGRRVPRWADLIAQADAVCELAPGTRFIFPHLLFLANDTERMAAFLDSHPNASLDLAPGNYFYGSLAANREKAVTFFDSYARRVCFGTDALFFPDDSSRLEGLPPGTMTGARSQLKRLWAFLATDDEVSNPYPLTREDCPSVRGLALAEDVLAEIGGRAYERILGGEPHAINREAWERYLEHARADPVFADRALKVSSSYE